MVAHIQGVQEAGYLAFAISVLSMICAIFQPVGLVLLPKATFMLAEGAHGELREHIGYLLKISFFVSAALAIFVAAFAPFLIRLYLGHGYEQVAGLVRIVVLGSVPYSIYLVSRNIIDAFHKNGITALIVLSALVAFCAGAVLGTRVGLLEAAVILSFMIALIILAGSSVLECRRILQA